MVSFESLDTKKIGHGLTGFGAILTAMGLLFFEKHFITMGNILTFSGVAFAIGVKCTLQLFLKPQNFKGSVSFAVGFLLVGIGWPIIGMILESYGFVILFSSWPGLIVSLRRLPVVGWIFWQPSVASFFQPNKVRGRRVPI